MSHHTECSLLMSLSGHSLCEGHYKYNCLIIVTELRYSQDILYFCKRRNEGSRKGQVSVCHQELLIMKCLPLNSLEHIPQLTLRSWRHELSLVLQWGQWTTVIWNAKGCSNVDLLHSRYHNPLGKSPIPTSSAPHCLGDRKNERQRLIAVPSKAQTVAKPTGQGLCRKKMLRGKTRS